MFDFVLLLHSWLRWATLVAALMATAAAFSIQRDGRGRDKADRWGLLFVIAMDLQLLLGFLLYFALSPTTAAIFDNFGAAMRDPAARFWAVEHVTLMTLAVVAVHLGRVLARKARTPGSVRTRLLVCFGLATIALLAAIPWPGMPAGRPLFRF
jgi:heme A synthase